MKISYRWLKDYVEFELGPEELADSLTNAGFEVEEYYPLIKEFTGVVVAQVTRVEKHPNADKLSVCRVATDREEYQVICGAPNVEQGQFVPFAQVGAVLPGGFKIKKARIRGVESFGMICSKEELGLEKASDGIWAFAEPHERGSSVYDLLIDRQDYIFDLAITPNRPDCLSQVGIAREVAALTGGRLKLPEVTLEETSSSKTADHIEIRIDDREGCPRYAGRVIKGVTVTESPLWMQQRLEAVGMRPINNIVDVTNYVLLELGHPLHAFDLAMIKERKIIVRTSHNAERFTTLDDKERELPAETVMICDAERAVAIGGIMGGLNSEVSAATVDILLESAYFKPERISRSSKVLGLSTEASQRFERGADPNGVPFALDRAAGLIAELAGGRVLQGICDVYPEKAEPVQIPFHPEKVNKLLGSRIAADKIIDTLKSIQLKVEGNKVEVPTFRVDLKQEQDLVEEVARLIGFSNLPTRENTTTYYEIGQSEYEAKLKFFRQALVESGLSEAINSGMLKQSEAEPFKRGELIRIMNPISDDMTTMRPSLLPGLLKAASHNINRNMKSLRLFEVGRIFQNYRPDELPEQPWSIAGLMTGKRYPEAWAHNNYDLDFFDVKGVLEAFIEKLFLDNIRFILYDKASGFLAAETIALQADDVLLGICGRVDPEICKLFDIEQPVFAFELNADRIMELYSFQRQYSPISRFPYSERDMALVLDDTIPASDVLSFVRTTGSPLLSDVAVFDVYKGEKIPAGKTSLAIRMRFQSTQRTLSDDEVDKVFYKIIKRCEKEFSAHLRK